MALAPDDLVKVRYFCGYPARGTSGAADAVDTAVAGLTQDEQDQVEIIFLPRLTTLEAAIPAAGGTLDTAEAAVWTRNPAELYERELLFYRQRLALCGFLGIPGGPYLLTPPVTVAPGEDGEVPDAADTIPPYIAVVAMAGIALLIGLLVQSPI
jgi:hypothetical protein